MGWPFRGFQKQRNTDMYHSTIAPYLGAIGSPLEPRNEMTDEVDERRNHELDEYQNRQNIESHPHATLRPARNGRDPDFNETCIYGFTARASFPRILRAQVILPGTPYR